MWTSKKELAVALKLALREKWTKWPDFVRFANTSDVFTRQGAPRCGVMKSYSARCEALFYFDNAFEAAATVSAGVLSDAVKTLRDGPCELVTAPGGVELCQGKDCLHIDTLPPDKDMEAALPFLEPAPQNCTERYLNGRESAELAAALRQLVYLPGKYSGEITGQVYMENRTRAQEGLEELLVCACNGYTAACAAVRVERLGGLGVWILPQEAARKLAEASKRLPLLAGCGLRLWGECAGFDLGRFEVRAQLWSGDFISPDITRPSGAQAAFEFERGQLLSNIQKAVWCGVNMTFEYEDGRLLLRSGGGRFFSDVRCEAGLDEWPQERKFAFKINAKRLYEAVKNLACARVRLYWAGENRPLYLAGENVRLCVLTEKEDKNDGADGK